MGAGLERGGGGGRGSGGGGGGAGGGKGGGGGRSPERGRSGRAIISTICFTCVTNEQHLLQSCLLYIVDVIFPPFTDANGGS